MQKQTLQAVKVSSTATYNPKINKLILTADGQIVALFTHPLKKRNYRNTAIYFCHNIKLHSLFMTCEQSIHEYSKEDIIFDVIQEIFQNCLSQKHLCITDNGNQYH